MKSAAVKNAAPGGKIRLSKIDPDDTGKMTKEEACTRFVDLHDGPNPFPVDRTTLPSASPPHCRMIVTRL